MSKSVEIFISYARKDKSYMEDLTKHLQSLKRQRLIQIWSDASIESGMDWKKAIDTHLDTAQIFLLLISSDFMASDYCYGIEMNRAVERHERGEARVIPIILSTISKHVWEIAPFSKLQALPKDAKPIKNWRDKENAYSNVVDGIYKSIEQMTTRLSVHSIADTPSPRGVISLPLATNSKIIQQRERTVEEVYEKLIAPHTTALVLTGIGGVGKSTLAALVYRYIEERCSISGRPFAAVPIWLSIDPSVTMIDLADSLLKALDKPLANFSKLAPRSQASVLFNALNSSQARLIVLDQFENLLDWQTGYVLPERPGIGEWLDILNSYPCSCRVLLTSRLRPQGPRTESYICLQEYLVGGLDIVEGSELLRKRGVEATDTLLHTVVEHCEGHSFALVLLASLLRNRKLSLAAFLKDPTSNQHWSGHIARNLFDYIYNQQINELQRELLLVFSTYREPVGINVVEAILDFNTKRSQVVFAIEALLNQHLLQALGEDYYQLHNIVLNYVQDHNAPPVLQKFHAEAALYYQNQASINCSPQTQRRQTSDIHLLIEAVWQWCQAKQWRQAYDLMQQEGICTDLNRWGNNALLLEFYQFLLPLEKWQQDISEAVQIYNDLGETSRLLGQMEQARRYLEQALNLGNIINNYAKSGWVLNNLGRVYGDQGQREKASKYYDEALEMFRQTGDQQGECTVLINRGWVYYDSQQMEQAREYYQRALRLCQKIGDRKGEGNALNNLGRVYETLNQIDQEKKYYEQALVNWREIGDRVGESRTLTNLGRVYSDLREYTRALDTLTLALNIRKEIGDRRGEGRTLAKIASINIQLGETTCALKTYTEALNIHREVGDRKAEAMTLENIGTFYLKQYRYDVALAFLLVAKEIFEDIQSPKINTTQLYIDKLYAEFGAEEQNALFAKAVSCANQLIEQTLQHL